MLYAQILHNIIVNIIVLDDPTLVPLFTQGFDACVPVPQVPAPLPGVLQTVFQPDIGWSYDGTNFNPPTGQ